MGVLKQYRKYIITLNNPRKHGVNHPKEMIELAKKLKGMIYACVSEEVGKNGTPHYHLFVIYKNPKSWNTLKNLFPHCDIEGAHGTNTECRDYVFKQGKWEGSDKEDTRVEGMQFDEGEIPPDRTSFDPKAEKLLELIKEGLSDYEIINGYPEYLFDLTHIQRVRLVHKMAQYENTWRNVEVYYIYGKPGLGKTRMIMDGFGYKNVFRVTESLHPWDTYQGEDVVIFEEFASSFRIQDMNNYLDSYPLKLPARYSDKTACYTKVFIISNMPLKKQYPNIQSDYDDSSKDTYKAFLRRFKGVIEFMDKNLLEYYEFDNEQHPIYKGIFTHTDFWERLQKHIAEGTPVIEIHEWTDEEFQEMLKTSADNFDPNVPAPRPAPFTEEELL